jgi:hypothetical protein
MKSLTSIVLMLQLILIQNKYQFLNLLFQKSLNKVEFRLILKVECLFNILKP